MEAFLPPVNRAMRVLDRAFFQKSIPLSAARLHKISKISSVKQELERSKDAILHARLRNIIPDPVTELANQGGKCLLLRPGIKHDDSTTWSDKLKELVKAEEIGLIPYNLHLGYDHWNYSEILNAILPDNEDFEVVRGFSIVGHVAHLNLHDHQLPYKNLIGAVILDKNRTIRTVINKTNVVGQENEYRTFSYEVLAGPDEMDVTVREQGCVFRFNYAKVYWNPRLHTEHERLVGMFREGEAVCDVMAGVGPFAIPAGKKRVFVWANDLNPDSYRSLVDGIKANKVLDFVRPFCGDGRAFIRAATADLPKTARTVRTPQNGKIPPRHVQEKRNPSPARYLVEPPTFSHYVMNLPASALSFLGAFVGLYPKSAESLFRPHTNKGLPMIHVYCFSTKSDDNVAQFEEICAEISKQIGFPVNVSDGSLSIEDVRDVAPNKRMFCASFRLPPEVAFRSDDA